MLRGVAGDLATEVASTLVEVCEGNPLALVELPATLNRGQRTGTEPLPSPLVPGVTLQEVMARRVAGLPPHARRALLICALEAGGNLA